MRVCLGTQNPDKVSGTEKAFSSVYGDVEVVPIAVRTGIPPQPMGLGTIVEGAKRRALEALGAVEGCDVGVGVEAGLYLLGGRFFDVQVAYVVTRDGREAMGLSPSFQVPDAFARSLVLGEARELENVVDEYFGTKDIGSRGGFVKLLTRSLVSREDLTFYAVLMALIPLINDGLYNR